MSHDPTTDDDRWAAVLERREADFLYGVLTTGVCCRTTCPSRRPHRANVRFYLSLDEARTDGLRPCKRCRPDEQGSARARLVAAACRLLEQDDGPADVLALAAAVAVSPTHLHRVFTAELGLTPKAYAEAVRAERARRALDGGGSITRAVHDAGFGSASRFYAATGPRLGMTPTRHRAGGDGERIRVAVGECSLGAVLVAATDRGVCAIDLGDDPALLLQAFQDRYHAAEVVAGDDAFEALVARVVGLVDAPGPIGDLPLDIRGTAFQERVWRALREVPPGATVTYTELAALVGAPSSVRAVAGACAANRLAVAVPCHRVVRADGSPSGYRWGLERKRALLDREARSGLPDLPDRERSA